MWPIKEKENRQLLMKWPNLIPLQLAEKNALLRFSYKHQPLFSNQPSRPGKAVSLLTD